MIELRCRRPMLFPPPCRNFFGPFMAWLVMCSWLLSLQAAFAGSAEQKEERRVTVPKAPRSSRLMNTWLRLPDWIDLSAEQRTRLEWMDRPFRVGEFGTDTQIPLRSRLHLRLNVHPFRLVFEGQDARTHLNDAGDFATTAVIDRADILQLFAAVMVDDILKTGLRSEVRVGRFTMDIGSRRYVARNRFRNTTNAFDGFHWHVHRDTVWHLQAFLVEPVQRRAASLDTQSARNLFWGMAFEYTAVPRRQLDLYYFGLNDQRHGSVARPRTLSTFGVRLLKHPAPGEIDYELEGALQTGRRGHIDHFAYNPHVQVGYTLAFPWHPRFLVQYDYASGTRAPDGTPSQTFDPLFGARRFELMPTGIFGPFQRSNISSPGWRVIVHPHSSWTVELKHRAWFLVQARDAYAGTGLQDPTGGSGNYLGQDLEMRIRWKANDSLLIDAGYDHWFKGSYFDRLPPSAGLPDGGERDTDYLYVSTTVRL
ncbi:MAG: hypothetical protein D6690_16400 [Nitrospirae bacterium]|nr:MAG: hypothetical protein D6690_16400 [Nitrospirota bacterium]